MKFQLHLVYYTTLFLIVDSKECIKQQFEKGDNDALQAQYKKEYGVISYALRLLSMGSNDFNITINERKKLCACVISKVSQTQQYDDDLLAKVYLEYYWLEIQIKGYLWFKPFSYYIPGMLCGADNDKITISKGYARASYTVPEYNIYVGKLLEETITDTSTGEKRALAQFEGIIRNVNV